MQRGMGSGLASVGAEVAHVPSLLPLSLFFTINAALLCVLSVVFAGHGIKALQEAGVLGTRPVAFFEFDWLGIHADAYSLGAQALALLAIMFLYGRSRLVEKRRIAAS